MKNSLCILLLTVCISCTVTRNIKIENKTEKELSEFYQSKGIKTFLVVKDFDSFKKLNDSNRITIPQNIVFDQNGFEIEHFDDKLCANHTLQFLKTYDSTTKVKLTNFKLRTYLSNFKIVNDSLKIEDIIEDKQIKVFVNSATYAEKPFANQEAFEIYNLYKDKFQVYVVNLDVGDWNSN